MNSLLGECVMPIFWQNISLVETSRGGINELSIILHLQMSSHVLALACWELHPEYGKYTMTCYSNVESQTDFFLKNITILMSYYNLFYKAGFKKGRGEGRGMGG